jgi:histidinol-phosphate phosphatase family protein
MAINLNKAVFIDKDGTLICDVPYNVDPTKITLQSGAGSTLRRLKEAGYKLIVISNQSGIARGYFPLEALAAVNQRIQELLEPYDVTIDDFYYCPHGPDDGCACRKPQPGLLLRAAEDYLVDMQQSWMIGDILHDVEAGNRAGCQTIHLDVGNETDWHGGAGRRPNYTVHSLKAVADTICRSTHERSHHEKAVSYNH